MSLKTKNQTNYFDKVIKVLKELKHDNPDVEISTHLSLATSDYPDIFALSDKELFQVLQKHKSEMDINTLSTKDMEKIISDTEDYFNDVNSGVFGMEGIGNLYEEDEEDFN